MQNYHVAGHFELRDNHMVEGWCWNPAAPETRLTVEIVADDTVVARVPADRFRRDLARDGIGDGHHGFRLTLAADAVPPDATLLSVRDAGGGRIFGRLRLRPPRGADPRLERLAASLDDMRRTLAPADRASAGHDFLRAGLAHVGARLAWPEDGPAGAALRGIARGLSETQPAAADARTSQPAATVLAWASGFDAAYRAASRLRPALSDEVFELLVIGSAADSQARLLAGLFGDVRLLDPPHKKSLAEVAWAAAALGTGRLLVLLDAAAGPLSAAVLEEIADRASDNTCVVGGIVDDMAAAIDVASGLDEIDPDFPDARPLLLAVDRELFRDLGGLDPALTASPSLAALDFSLKAALLGIRAIALRDSGATIAPRGRMAPDKQAHAVFGATWGLHPGAGLDHHP